MNCQLNLKVLNSQFSDLPIKGNALEARAFHIWYEHVSIGTTPVLHIQHDPETLASKLKLLHGQFWG